MWELQHGQDAQAQAGSWMQAGAVYHLQGCGNQTCSKRTDTDGRGLKLNMVKKVDDWAQEIC